MVGGRIVRAVAFRDREVFECSYGFSCSLCPGSRLRFVESEDTLRPASTEGYENGFFMVLVSGTAARRETRVSMREAWSR
jgi:hypothetical protein